MKILRTLILAILTAATTLTAGAQTEAGAQTPASADAINTAAMKAHNDSLTAAAASPDYIQVSLLVATPGLEVYSTFGHAAIRMQCPSKGVDKCFEFASLVNVSSTLEFIKGTMEGMFMRLYTKDYIDRYRKEGRGVTELKLNLTPEEKVNLWRLADQQCNPDNSWRFDYMVNYCSYMAAWLVESSLDGATITLHDPMPEILGTHREAFRSYQKVSPWSFQFWNMLMGTFGDEPTEPKSLLYPVFITDTWKKSTITDREGNERPLVTSEKVLTKATRIDKPVQPTPLTVMIVLLVLAIGVSIVEWRKGYNIACRITDTVLFAVQFLVGLLITYLLVFSHQVATEWNWLIIAFNPLPLLLWICLRRKPVMRRLYRLFTVVVVAFALCTPFMPQLLFSQLYVLLAAFAVRTFVNGWIVKCSFPCHGN
jgi:hypothetical protein